MQLKQAVAGNFYIQTRLFGKGSFVTFQVSQEGIDYLARRNLKVGDEIPQDLFVALQDRGMLTTGKSGVSTPEESQTIERLAKLARLDIKAQKLPLRVNTRANDWRLELWIPSIRQKAITSDRGYLKREWVQVDGERIQLLELVNGSIGLWQRVDPHTSEYEVDCHTTAITAYFPQEWSLDSEGLLQAGNLFHADERGNTRLLPSEGVAPGETYYLLLEKVNPLPPSIQVEGWRKINNWHLGRITLPIEIDPPCEKWLKGIEQFIERVPLSVRFITPPPTRLDGDVLPTLPPMSEYLVAVRGFTSTTKDVLVEVRSEDGSVETSRFSITNPLWLKLDKLERGRHALLIASGRQTKAYPFQIADVPSPTLPKPLSLRLKSKSREFTLCGSWDPTRCHQLDTNEFAEPNIEIGFIETLPDRMPISIEIASADHLVKSNYTGPDSLRKAVQSLSDPQVVSIRIDADCFGSLLIAPKRENLGVNSPLAGPLRHKICWLIEVLCKRRPRANGCSTSPTGYGLSRRWLSQLDGLSDPLIQDLRSAITIASRTDELRRYAPHIAFVCDTIHNAESVVRG